MSPRTPAYGECPYTCVVLVALHVPWLCRYPRMYRCGWTGTYFGWRIVALSPSPSLACTHTRISKHMPMHMSMKVHTHVHTDVNTHVCLYTCPSVSVGVYPHMRARARARAHVSHTHEHMTGSSLRCCTASPKTCRAGPVQTGATCTVPLHFTFRSLNSQLQSPQCAAVCALAGIGGRVCRHVSWVCVL